jgi:glycosyltransferase involved in cell wall biosynthesis
MRAYLVTPWFGVGSGGAERAAHWFAAQARAAGFNLRVLSTTLGNPFHDKHQEVFPTGEGDSEGIPVIRFCPRQCGQEALDNLLRRIERRDELSLDQQREFFRANVSSADMEEFICSQPEGLFIFVPYYYGTTVLGATVAERFVLIPCLHDEPVAELSLLRSVFSRNCDVLFLSEPEEGLFRSLYGDGAVRRSRVTGFSAPEPPNCRADRFLNRFPPGKKILLFLGRKHRDKGAADLVFHFDRYCRGNPDTRFVLALAGPGEIGVDLPAGDHIQDVGMLTEEEKWDALAGSYALVHPSLRESFSIVLMEAWACGRPVVVNEDCAVTRWHAERANGGLWYGDYETFAAGLDYLARHPDEAAAMGSQGRQYIEREYNPRKVAQAFTDFLREVTEND